eukprot:4408548-Prymnesium_polylepis.1
MSPPCTAAAPMRHAGSMSRARTACTRWRPCRFGKCQDRTPSTRAACSSARPCPPRMPSGPRFQWEHRSQGWQAYTHQHLSGWSHLSSCPACMAAARTHPPGNSAQESRSHMRWRLRGPAACQLGTWCTSLALPVC